MEYVAVKASDLIFLMLAFSVNSANFTQFITYGEYLQFYMLLFNPIFSEAIKAFMEKCFSFICRCYTDLQDRKQCREGTWKEDEWNDIVSHTVPLIRTMKTRILEPLPYSPTQ